jgi:ankyrin repeat protein
MLIGSRFRWVACQFDVLEHCLDPPSVRRELQTLPSTLDETYDRILERIHPNQIKNAKRLLQFLIYSEQPLTLGEATDIIAIDPSSTPAFVPEDRVPIPEKIIGYFSSLVTLVPRDVTLRNPVVKPTDIEIHLAHFSVKEYLTSNRLKPDLAAEFSEIPAKTCIVEACISYLLSIYQSCSPQAATELYYLASFSADNWMKHARDVELFKKETIPRVEEYYLCLDVCRFWYEIHTVNHPLTNVSLIEPLCHASAYGLLYSSIFLLQNIAEMDANSRIYGDALLIASRKGYSEIVKALLENGVDANIRSPYLGIYSSALHGASSTGHLEATKILLNYGADANMEVDNYGSPLQVASIEGYAEITKLLLDNGANVNAKGGRYGNALRAASIRGHPQIVEILLDGNADIDQEGDDSFSVVRSSALQAASREGHLGVVKILLDRGADIHAKDTYNVDALGAASEKGCLEIANMLINKGAKVNAGTGCARPLYLASTSGHLGIIKLLLDNGADVNAQGNAYDVDCSALCAASRYGHLEAAKMLLDNGADINMHGGQYGNALCAASGKGRLEVVKMLLDHKADINMQDGDYGNALVAASAWGHLEVAKILLENGAAINVQTVQGRLYNNALEAAMAQRRSRVIKFLLDNGAKLAA